MGVKCNKANKRIIVTLKNIENAVTHPEDRIVKKKEKYSMFSTPHVPTMRAEGYMELLESEKKISDYMPQVDMPIVHHYLLNKFVNVR